ncbi:MAG: hypothetical protein KGI66_02560, partial [Patescibacteria group bacterium]|nr:hypothetical protein [Patescibacteria group bacterium]
MSRITQKPAVGVLNPWGVVPTNSNLSSSITATPVSGAQAYSAIPTTGTQPSSGTGVYDPSFGTYIGEKFDTSDGRTLVIVQNGTVAIGSGKLCQSAAEVTAFQKLAITVPATYPATAGTTQIYVTNGSTVLNVNQFQNGYLVVEAGTGAGQMFKIASYQAAAANAKFVVNLEDPIQTTLDATSTVNLVVNPYSGVIVFPHGSPTGVPVGVTITSLAASTAATYNGTSGLLTANGVAQYGLLQTHGPATCLIDTTTTVGYPLGPAA